MVALKIHKPPMCGDSAKTTPRDRWDELMDERRNFCREIVPADCRMLLFFLEDGADSNWLGFDGRDEYLRSGLGLDPEMVGWAETGLRKTRPEKAIPFDQAVALGLREIGVPGGKAGPGRGKKTADYVSRFQHGNQASYTLARLERDRPDLAVQIREDADKVVKGKMKRADAMTPNKAAIAAGFRKRMVSVPATDLTAAVRILCKHYDPMELSIAAARLREEWKGKGSA